MEMLDRVLYCDTYMDAAKGNHRGLEHCSLFHQDLSLSYVYMHYSLSITLENSSLSPSRTSHLGLHASSIQHLPSNDI